MGFMVGISNFFNTVVHEKICEAINNAVLKNDVRPLKGAFKGGDE